MGNWESAIMGIGGVILMLLLIMSWIGNQARWEYWSGVGDCNSSTCDRLRSERDRARTEVSNQMLEMITCQTDVTTAKTNYAMVMKAYEEELSRNDGPRRDWETLSINLLANAQAHALWVANQIDLIYSRYPNGGLPVKDEQPDPKMNACPKCGKPICETVAHTCKTVKKDTR